MCYTGKVMDRDSGLPVCGVAVTDGRNICLTDCEGKYALPGWARSHTVAVCALTNCHDDWYHYTGGSAGVYDFFISPAQTNHLFRVLQTSDTEIGADSAVEWLDFIKGHIQEKEPAFLIHTGDICREEGLIRHRKIMNHDTMGCPVRYVIGNHDFISADAHGDYGEQLYEKLYGPVWYSFDCGEVHCLVLSLGYGGRGDMGTGYQPEDQWTWLKNDLQTAAKGKHLAVFCHDCGPDPYCFVTGDIALKNRGLLVWIHGHDHSNRHLIRDGVHIICTGRPDCGGIDSSAAGIRAITIEKGQVSSKMLYHSIPVSTPDIPVWQIKLPGNISFCKPEKHDNALLVGTIQEAKPGSCGIYCIDCQTGEIRWCFETESSLHSNLSLDGDKLYAQDNMGFLYCLDARSGVVIWQKEIPLTRGRTRFPAFVAGDAVLAGEPSHVRAYDKTSGALRWEVKTRGGQTPARPVYDSKHHRILISAQWGALLCVDAANGKEVWKRTEKPIWYRTATPCLHEDVIYTGGFNTLVKLDAETGLTIAEKDIGCAVNVCGGPVAEGDILYCPTGTCGVVAVDKSTLEILRKYPTGSAGILTAPYVRPGAQTVESQPAVDGETLAFTAADAKLYFYNKKTAELQKTICLPAPSLVAPILEKTFVYTADYSGTVCKFRR